MRIAGTSSNATDRCAPRQVRSDRLVRPDISRPGGFRVRRAEGCRSGAAFSSPRRAPNCRTGKPQPADRPQNSAPGREVPSAFTGEAGRSRGLSGGRTGRHRPAGGQRLIAADFIRDRDILTVSQRGTMFSEPALTCAPIDNFARELLSLRFYSEITERAHLAAAEACHRELAATGADLSAYNGPSLAHRRRQRSSTASDFHH